MHGFANQYASGIIRADMRATNRAQVIARNLDQKHVRDRACLAGRAGLGYMMRLGMRDQSAHRVQSEVQSRGAVLRFLSHVSGLCQCCVLRSLPDGSAHHANEHISPHHAQVNQRLRRLLKIKPFAIYSGLLIRSRLLENQACVARQGRKSRSAEVRSSTN